MSASFSRSICTHCLPGASSTHEPSSPSLSPSVIKSSVPMTGSLSLAVTFLPFARFSVPAGTRKSGRLPFCAGSRFGTLIGTGVPTNSGLGRSVFSGTLSCASKVVVASRVTVRDNFKNDLCINDMISGFSFSKGDVNGFAGGDGLVRLVNDIFAAKRLVGRTIQFSRAADGVKKVLQMRLVDFLVERDRDVVLQQGGRFPDVHLVGVADGRNRAGAQITFGHEIVPGRGAVFAVELRDAGVLGHLD